MMSWFKSSILRLFNAAFFAHVSNICSETSSPVTTASLLFASRHIVIPPVPMPTSRTLVVFDGANDASQTASDVGL